MEERKTYCNPVTFTDGRRHTNPDPYVMRWCGRYYCYATDEMGVKVSVSDDLVQWEYRGYAIRDEAYRDYWAPSVIYLNGVFYMYYSNIPAGESDNHMEYLKLAVSRDPEKGFQWKKTFFDKFSIDSHPILWNGKLYLFYSVNDWMGTDDETPGTCILVDEMVSPEEFSGDPRPVLLPGIRQEIFEENRFGDGRPWYTIEGAAPVVRGDYFWLLYSANAYVNVDYYIGSARACIQDDLLDMTWEKCPDNYTWHPFLKRNEEVEGTGHNTVVKAPNMVDDWIVYHGRNAREELKPGLEQREMYIDPLYFNGGKILCFGPTACSMEAPALSEIQMDEFTTETQKLLGEASPYYYMELWVSARYSHMGARFGICLEYQDADNYLEVQVFTGRREMKVIRVRGCIRAVLASGKLRKDFDYTVPHLFRVTRSFKDYTIILDDELQLQGAYGEMYGTLELMPHYSEVTLYSFTLTRTIMLSGKKLQDLSYLYHVSPCIADKDGLYENQMILTGSPCKEGYREIFLMRAETPDNRLELCTAEGTQILAQKMCGEYSVYHVVQGEKEKFLVEGVWSQREYEGGELILRGLKITEYELTLLNETCSDDTKK